MQAQGQEGYRRGTPVTPGGAFQQNPSWPNYAVPPPPPPPIQQGTQMGSSMYPPPPPRPPMGSSQHFVPPPPGQNNGYGTWNRQPTYAPVQNQHREPRAYDPSLYLQYEHFNSNIPADNQPLTSATYIPGPESFGPGVGIPPLHANTSSTVSQTSRSTVSPPQFGYYRGQNSEYGANNDLSRYGGDGTMFEGTGTRYPSGTWQHAQPASSQFLSQSLPPTTPTIMRHKTLINPAKETEQLRSPSQEYPSSGFGFGKPSSADFSVADPPTSPDDVNWSPERVQSFLAANSFSREWQDAFQHLNVYGAQFLEIGGRGGGQRNIGLMQMTILPQVARECTSKGVLWDQAKEREQGKRLRRLIKDVIQNGGVATPQTAASSSTTSLPLKTNRRESNNFITSASADADGGVESSPNLSRPDGLGWAPASATGEESPGRGMSTRHVSGQRAATYDSASNTWSENARSQFSQQVLGSVSDITRRHSPNASSDLGAGGDRMQSSPQQSPGLSTARPSTSSAVQHARYYSNHLRGNSSDTNIPLSAANRERGLSEDPTKRRNAQDAFKTSGDSGKSNNLETPSSAKERRGLWPKFRRGRRDDSVLPSPDEEPSSPQNSKHEPYSRLGHASSESSLADPVASKKSGGQPSIEFADETRINPADSSKAKKYMFATPDGFNFRLIDISDARSAAQLRTLVCSELDLNESPEVSIYLTFPGKVDYEEDLDDTSLMRACTQMADSAGTLKLYIYDPSRSNARRGSAGFASSGLPTSPFSRAFITRRPSDGGASANVGSPSTLNSGESTLVPEKMRSLHLLLGKGDESDSGTGTNQARKDLLDKKAAEHKKETERKRDAFDRRGSRFVDQNGKVIHDFDRSLRSGNEQNGRPLSSGSADFDRKTDSFQPMRKAPPVPEPTSTLVKANSLTKKNSNHGRVTWPSRKEEPWKRISNGSIPEERPGSKGNSTVGQSSTAPAAASSLQKSLLAPDLLAADLKYSQRTMSGSPKSPRNQFSTSKGGPTFKMPEYVENDEGPPEDEDTLKASRNPTSLLQTPSVRRTQGDGRSSSPNVSPSSRRPASSGLSRMASKRGPSFDVPEPQVEFNTSFDPLSDSDDESDDGLFAIPLTTQKQSSPILPPPKQKSAAPTVSAKAASILGIDVDTPVRSPNRPTLKLKTSRSNVKFDTSGTTTSRNKTGGQEDLNGRENPQFANVPVSSNIPWSASSPDESARFGRRESFASDLWASRPPVEGIAEHLDEFFPNVDLDQPMGEDVEGAEGSPTAADKLGLASKASASDLNSGRTMTPTSGRNGADMLGGGDPSLKRGDITSVAQRSMRKAGGLGRTKSIRDVVKNNYQPGSNAHNPSITSQASSRYPGGQGPPGAAHNLPSRVATLKNDGGIMRRKSTKMFGARIQQVKPRPGSRLIQNLDPIPQDTIPVGNTHNYRPERQPTFKWMKGQLIGKGTFGRVYLGMNTTTGELLAVKQVEVNPNQGNADPARIREMVKALDQEIDTMQHLDHMNIVQYLGCERKEYSISIFLEYISGGSVGSCLRKHGKFEEPVVASLTSQTLSGLSYLHSECILHRDLKADNILLDLDGTCKISDFGISKKSADPYNNDITNSMQGSVFWMAPEVIRAQSQALSTTSSGAHLSASASSQGYSAKVDIWSLGCVVLEMFAGRRPWSKEEAIGAIYKLGSLNQAPPIPDDVSSVVGPAALSFMYDCFTIDPSERPTAETLLHAPFCTSDPHYNFLDTELYSKIRGAF